VLVKIEFELPKKLPKGVFLYREEKLKSLQSNKKNCSIGGAETSPSIYTPI
jgi:hypothetical protein